MTNQQSIMPGVKKRAGFIGLLCVCLLLGGCDGNVGVGVSVGVPVGNHGYMSVGGTRWR